MHALHVLKVSKRIDTGLVLDIGVRDFRLVRLFRGEGFQVHAIDRDPVVSEPREPGITFDRATLEDFRTNTAFDVEVASYISHLVRYMTEELLLRLNSLAAGDGAIFVTFIGDRDDWPRCGWARSLDRPATCDLIAKVGLTTAYESEQRFDGWLYDGSSKHWLMQGFVLTAQQNV